MMLYVTCTTFYCTKAAKTRLLHTLLLQLVEQLEGLLDLPHGRLKSFHLGLRGLKPQLVQLLVLHAESGEQSAVELQLLNTFLWSDPELYHLNRTAATLTQRVHTRRGQRSQYQAHKQNHDFRMSARNMFCFAHNIDAHETPCLQGQLPSFTWIPNSACINDSMNWRSAPLRILVEIDAVRQSMAPTISTSAQYQK